MTKLKDRILQYLKYKQYSQAKFEKMAKLSNGFVNNLGDNLQKKSLDKISNAFYDLNIEWLKNGFGEMILDDNSNRHNNITYKENVNHNENILNDPDIQHSVTQLIEPIKQKGTPMYSSAATASEVEVYDDMLNDGPAFFVNIPQFRDCSFGKMVFGHSMYPTYESGTYIFCKPITDKYVIAPGEVYYIEIDNFAYCKRLQLSEIPGEYLAESDNEEIRKDGLRRYRTFPIKIDKIRNIYLVKGHFKQSQN